MESLALLVVVIILSVIFFAAFAGFVIGDNVENTFLIWSFGIVPGIIPSVMFGQYLFSFLWGFSYFLGFQIGRLFK